MSLHVGKAFQLLLLQAGKPWVPPVQAQLAVGSQGLPVLCTIIKEEREDTDMLRAALECLTIAIGNPTQHPDDSVKVLNVWQAVLIPDKPGLICLEAHAGTSPCSTEC